MRLPILQNLVLCVMVIENKMGIILQWLWRKENLKKTGMIAFLNGIGKRPVEFKHYGNHQP